ncbi:MAG: hypothetical protein KM310_02325 [Clostridiales bacterium]|nr:hypothetical protein [Clostridiales bacterium]
MKKGMANVLGVKGWMVYKVETGTDEADVYVGRPKKEARCPHCGAVTRHTGIKSSGW